MQVGERVTWGGVVWECTHEGRKASSDEWCWYDDAVDSFHHQTSGDYPILRPVAIAGQEAVPDHDPLSAWMRGVRAGMDIVRAEVRTCNP